MWVHVLSLSVTLVRLGDAAALLTASASRGASETLRAIERAQQIGDQVAGFFDADR